MSRLLGHSHREYFRSHLCCLSPLSTRCYLRRLGSRSSVDFLPAAAFPMSEVEPLPPSPFISAPPHPASLHPYSTSTPSFPSAGPVSLSTSPAPSQPLQSFPLNPASSTLSPPPPSVSPPPSSRHYPYPLSTLETALRIPPIEHQVGVHVSHFITHREGPAHQVLAELLGVPQVWLPYSTTCV